MESSTLVERYRIGRIGELGKEAPCVRRAPFPRVRARVRARVGVVNRISDLLA